MKRIQVKVAGTEKIRELEIGPETLGEDILVAVRDDIVAATCYETEWEIYLRVGVPPVGREENLYEQVEAGGKIFVVPHCYAE